MRCVHQSKYYGGGRNPKFKVYKLPAGGGDALQIGLPGPSLITSCVRSYGFFPIYGVIRQWHLPSFFVRWA